MEQPRETRPDTIQLENWVDEAVMGFIIEMKYKLRLNNHKGHWKEYPIEYLLRRLNDEVLELRGAIEDQANKRKHKLHSQKFCLAVIHECADIANFAMMIADNARRTMQIEEKHRQ